MIKVQKRHDGLTSEQRKVKIGFEERQAMCELAKDYWSTRGWRLAVTADVKALKNGTEIRCLAYMCGCVGQVERVRLQTSHDETIRWVNHTRHDLEFAILERNKAGTAWKVHDTEEFMVRVSFNRFREV